MPKPYLLGVEVEEASLGTVMRRMHKIRGIGKIHMDMDQRRIAKPNGAAERKQFEVSGESRLQQLLYDNEVMNMAELREAFIADGRSPASLASIMHSLQKKKILEKRANGWGLNKIIRDRLRRRYVAEKKAKKKAK